jgi:hypothetical protein
VINLKYQNLVVAAEKGSYVYCYLREKDLTPYYIGVASTSFRPLDKRHCCVVPKDKKRIRVMKSGLTQLAAFEWEIFYIAHYGRKDLGTGILRNRTDGGDGLVPGHKWTKEELARRSQTRLASEKAKREREGITDEVRKQRRRESAKNYARRKAVAANGCVQPSNLQRMKDFCQRHEIDFDIWRFISAKARHQVRMRIVRGWTMPELMDGVY